MTNPETFRAIVEVPLGKCEAQIHRKGRQLARALHLTTDYPTADYLYFRENPSEVDAAFIPDQQRSDQTGLDLLANKMYFDRPVFVPEDAFRKESTLDRLRSKTTAAIKNYLAERAANDSSEEMAEFYGQRQCDRSPASPYFYQDYQVWDVIADLGFDKAQAILASSDDRDTQRQVESWQFLRELNIDWDKRSERDLVN